MDDFFSCSPVRSASLTASRLRNTATGCPIFIIAWANSSPIAPRQLSAVVMCTSSGWFSGAASAPVRSSCAFPGGTAADQNTEQEDDDPSHGRPRCGMAARRLGGNLARISGSVYGGALDLAAGTIEAWHAMNAACG